MKKAKSISTPIRSRWTPASETTFVSMDWREVGFNKSFTGLRFPAKRELHLNEWFSIHPVCRDVSVRFRASLDLLPLFMNANGLEKVEYFSRDLCKRRRSILMEVYDDG
ncbi:hypothetical protein CEXT_305451 [Caerostris extrusa]|uniref:Uncharacterized protein n=1 Tax=Caerostris extrusa TaxID=172846 RepID=A0AAV4P503_CAEEX|nr:hypothetical protein CEXT_305451 [Caerostris extrusa]